MAGAYDYLCKPPLEDRLWARYACAVGKWGKIANEPSSVADYSEHQRIKPIPHFIGGLLKRWNNWCQAGRKRCSKFRERALVPGETKGWQLAPKADEYLRTQSKV
jgi:hypothetical protein